MVGPSVGNADPPLWRFHNSVFRPSIMIPADFHMFQRGGSTTNQLMRIRTVMIPFINLAQPCHFPTASFQPLVFPTDVGGRGCSDFLVRPQISVQGLDEIGRMPVEPSSWKAAVDRFKYCSLSWMIHTSKKTEICSHLDSMSDSEVTVIDKAKTIQK